MALNRDTFVITGAPPASFPLSAAPANPADVMVYLNGMLMDPGADYSLIGSGAATAAQFVTVQPIESGDIVQIVYQPAASTLSTLSTGAPGLNSAQAYIYTALRKCGQMRPGYSNAPELLADCLNEWWVLFDGWNAERTMQYTMPDFVYPVTGPGHGVTGNGQTWGGSGYQIGPTALDFVGPRPVKIARMNLLLTSVPSTPARVPMSQISMEEWTAIAVVELPPINVATTFAYDPQWPNGVIWVWPPLSGNSLEVFEWGQLAPPSSLADPYTAPPGYADAILWSLAERFWPYCTRDVMVHKLSLDYIAGKAIGARAKVKGVNAPMPRLSSDFKGGNGSRAGALDLDLLTTGRPY